ncbi:MAG: nucleotidyltransferase family protein, partial [Deltaproteobacteria bacterium]|nr:nucleotidyltransferase family protein [Deltaproteobacteria bacterium]
MTPSTPMDRYTTRLKALDWLLEAVRPWLLQDEGTPRNFPQGTGVGWTSVNELAYFHNLEPLLFWVVSTRDAETDVPVWLKEKWEQAYFEKFIKNGEQLQILTVLLDKWNQAGVSVIVLKGPALIGRIYRDPALRPMSDLDILCSKNDLGIVVDTARRMGYQTGAVGDDPASIQHVSMYHGAAASLLECHFRPYETIKNHPLFMEMAWDQREWIDVDGVRCPVLSLEMELVLALAHLAHHQFDVALKHLVDIAGLLIFCRSQFSWSETDALLREFKVDRVFKLVTGSISRLMDLDLPLSNREHTGRQEWDASLRELMGLLDQDRLMDLKGIIWGFRMSVHHRRGWWEKCRFIKSKMCPFLDATACLYGISSKRDVFRYYLRRIL